MQQKVFRKDGLHRDNRGLHLVRHGSESGCFKHNLQRLDALLRWRAEHSLVTFLDDPVLGVKAIDRDGNQSVVAPYREPVLPGMLTPSQAK